MGASLALGIGGLVVVVCVILLRMLPLLLTLLLWVIQHDCIFSILSTIFVILIFFIVDKAELRKRDIRRTPYWPRTPRLVARNANLSTCRPSVTLPMTMCMSPTAILPALSLADTMLSAFEQDTPRLTTIRWRRSQTAGHRSKAPFLDIGLDEDKAHLSKIDVHFAGACSADGGKQVRMLESVRYVFELATVAGEEDCARAGTIADADDIADNIWWSIGRCGCEGLVEPTIAGGEVGDGCFV